MKEENTWSVHMDIMIYPIVCMHITTPSTRNDIPKDIFKLGLLGDCRSR